jgi:hypothetical protein
VLVLLAGLGVGAFLYLRPDPTPAASAPPGHTALYVGWQHCGSPGDMTDAEHTLFLDLEGARPNSGRLTLTNLRCVLTGLDAPSHVTVRMNQTRAIDGRETDTWASLEASWTYYPDDGLDVLIKEK